MVKAIELRLGNIVSVPSQKGYMKVISTVHQKPGKGPAYMQIEFNNITTGNKINIRFRSDEDIDKYEHRIEKASFSYSDIDFFYLMLNETSEEVVISKSLVDKNFEKMLQDNMELSVNFIGDEIISIDLPDKAIYKIKQVDNPSKRASMKPAILENGLTVLVPDFVVSEEEILIRTGTLEYIERVK